MCLLPPSSPFLCSNSTNLSSLPNHGQPSLASRMFASGWCLWRLSHGWPPPSPRGGLLPPRMCTVIPTQDVRCAGTPQPRCIFRVKASGRSKTYHGLALSADFLTPKEPFCTCVVSPESRGRGWEVGGGSELLSPLPKQDFPSLFLPWLLS